VSPPHAAPTGAAPLPPLSPLTPLALSSVPSVPSAASDSRSMRMAARRRERQQRWVQKTTAEGGGPGVTPSRRSELLDLKLARAREQRKRQEDRVFAQLRNLQAASEQRVALKEKHSPTAGGAAYDTVHDNAVADHRLMAPAWSLGQADGQLLDLGLEQLAVGRHGGNDGLMINLDLLKLSQRHHIRRWLIEQNRAAQVMSLIASAPPQTRQALTALLERLLCAETDEHVATSGALRLRLGARDQAEVVALEIDPPSPAPLNLQLTRRSDGSRGSLVRSSPSAIMEEAHAPLIAKGSDDEGESKRAGETDRGLLV